MPSLDEWRSQDRSWDEIPQSVKQIAEQILQIPKDHTSTLLPPPHISVNAMLKFPLPNSTMSTSPSDAQTYFSHKQPNFLDDALVLSLHCLIIPPASTVQKLSRNVRQAWLEGYNSVKYAHIAEKTGAHFPLWVITFWNCVLDIRAKIRKPWHEAQHWLQKQMYNPRSAERRRLARQANELLDALPWKGRKSGPSDHEENHDLWRYLGDQWLRSTEEDDMLELLRHRI
ncbi:hypothetical protein JOM56_009858, partial [Amanita muscaria]